KLDDRDARMRLAAAQAALMQVRARLGLPLETPKDGDDTHALNTDNVPEVRLARANAESAKVDLERSAKLKDQCDLAAQRDDMARSSPARSRASRPPSTDSRAPCGSKRVSTTRAGS